MNSVVEAQTPAERLAAKQTPEEKARARARLLKQELDTIRQVWPDVTGEMFSLLAGLYATIVTYQRVPSRKRPALIIVWKDEGADIYERRDVLRYEARSLLPRN